MLDENCINYNVGAQLRAPLGPLKHRSSVLLSGLKQGPQMGPHYVEKRQLLGHQMYFFCSLAAGDLLAVYYTNGSDYFHD